MPADDALTRERVREVLRLVEEWRVVSSAGECPRCGGGGWKACSPPICIACGYQPSLTFEEVAWECAGLASMIDDPARWCGVVGVVKKETISKTSPWARGYQAAVAERLAKLPTGRLIVTPHRDKEGA